VARRKSRTDGRRGSVVWGVVAAVLWYLFSAGWAYAAVELRAGAVQSSYVQAHGLRDSATVVSVHNIIRNSGKHSTTHTAEVTVHLQQPVNGTFNSVVHVPHRDNSSPGDTIAVLVDPRQPGYSELQGSPDTKTWYWLVSLGISLLSLLAGVKLTRETVQLSRQRQAAGDFAYPGSPPDRS